MVAVNSRGQVPSIYLQLRDVIEFKGMERMVMALEYRKIYNSVAVTLEHWGGAVLFNPEQMVTVVARSGLLE